MEIDSIFKLLPTEIRQEIFKNFDKGTLFKCLLLDRQFCREIVPILWEAPLLESSILKQRTISADKQMNNIIGVYVRSFTNTTWMYLYTNGNGIRPQNTRQPTFNYASFLRHYEPNSVYIAVGVWLLRNSMRNDHINCKLVASSLCKLFLTESNLLRSLHYDFENDKDFWDSIPQDCSAQVLLKNLKELKIHEFSFEKHQPMFFENLANACHSIRGVTLEANSISPLQTQDIRVNKHTVEGLKKALSAQSELQWIRIYSFPSYAIKLICHALNPSAEKLRAIQFSGINFEYYRAENIISGLSACINLLCLDFINCTSLEQQYWYEAAQNFQKLEYLSIQSSASHEMPVNLIKEIIKSSGDSLHYLRIQCHENNNFADVCYEILPLILAYSYNLSAIDLINMGVENLTDLFNACPNLEHLNVYSKNLLQAFRVLSRKLVPNIKSLEIHVASYQDLVPYYQELPIGEEALFDFLEVICQNVKRLYLPTIMIDNEYQRNLADMFGIKVTCGSMND
ncbi:12004_t:CDS:1, partial [Ambispora leptoticha]